MNVETRIYTTPWCPDCHKAKALLDRAGVKYTEVDVDGKNDVRAWLKKKSGQRTVPQIFFNTLSIGGCTDLESLLRSKTLSATLDRAANDHAGQLEF